MRLYAASTFGAAIGNHMPCNVVLLIVHNYFKSKYDIVLVTPGYFIVAMTSSC